MHSREVIFDGYRRVHVDSEDEIKADEVVKETFEEAEVLKRTSLVEEAKETQPPKRYSEASFIKELDKRGIGRPSTFATIIKTLLSESRGYCVLSEKLIHPTAKGRKLSEFLDEKFPDLFNLHYTSELEDDLDKIARGQLEQEDFLRDFYNNLEGLIKKIDSEERVCPQCGSLMVKRHSKFGAFWGCSAYPKCKYIAH